MYTHHRVQEWIDLKIGWFCLFLLHVSTYLMANPSLPPFADAMWWIKHAQRTRAGTMAYADVCLCMTHSFPSSTRVRAITRLWCVCVCVLKRVLHSTYFPHSNLNTHPTIACKMQPGLCTTASLEAVNRTRQTCQQILRGRDCAQRVSTNRTWNNTTWALLVQMDAFGTIIFSKPSNLVVKSREGRTHEFMNTS